MMNIIPEGLHSSSPIGSSSGSVASDFPQALSNSINACEKWSNMRSVRTALFEHGESMHSMFEATTFTSF